MDNHTFSAREAVKTGLKNAWRDKWTSLGLMGSILGLFVLLAAVCYCFIWFIDWAVAYRISMSVAAMLDISEIASFHHLLAYFHIILYGVFGLLVSSIITNVLMRYWLIKMFVIQANTGHVCWRNVVADPHDFLAVFNAQVLLSVLDYCCLFIITYFESLILILIGSLAVVIVLLRLRYFSCFVIDKHVSAFQSISLSYRSTKGWWFKVLKYLLLYVLILMGLALFYGLTYLIPLNILGNILYVITVLVYFVLGAIVTIGIYASDVYVYKILSQEYEEKQALTEQQQENNTLGN